jgi:hypothetical protein
MRMQAAKQDAAREWLKDREGGLHLIFVEAGNPA